jgi:asparagine synthetase B (glutamine-hydrolysing)
VARYFRYEGCLDAAGLRALLEARCLDRMEDGAEAAMLPFHRPDLPAVAAAQYMDMHLYLVDHILCKVDRASMAHGVEARVPFLDPELVKLAFRIPLGLHYRNGERKALLKQVAAQLLPARVVTPRKKGFSSPMGIWFDARLDPWMRGWMEDGMLVQLGLLRPDWPQRLSELQAERGAEGLRARWLLLTAELWARRWIAGENLGAAAPACRGGVLTSGQAQPFQT